MIVLAILLAVVAASCFAASVSLQHGAVRETGHGLSPRLMRSRRWLAGTALGATGAGLHVVALALAPLAVVQPIGVLSLVLTVVFSSRARLSAVLAVCVGTAGFVLVAATSTAASADVDPVGVQVPVLGALVLAGLAVAIRGRLRCLLLATAAAVLFGLGSALIRAATQDFALWPAAESAVLILLGGWLVHRAYDSGSPAVVVGATTVVDPITGVAVGLWLYGESAVLAPGQAVALAAFAALSVTGVLVLAKETPPQKGTRMPHGDGLKILIGADTFPPDINGAANFAGRLAQGLAGRGHDVHVVSPATAVPIGARGITRHPVSSVRTPFHPTFRVSPPWRATREAEAVLRRVRPDVVHVQSHFPVGRAVLRAARRQGIPVVATNHFMPENLLGYVPVPRALRGPVVRWAWRDLVRVFGAAQVVTAPTPRAVDLLTTHGMPGSPLAISCGIDLAHYPPHETAGKTVLFVGRLDAEKNVDELIRAVAVLPDVRAEIVGDGGCRLALTALARELGVADRVRFRGFVSDAELAHAYREADLFCMPGTAELQSLATMEAMAAGLPVVAADAVALPHLVRDGVTGFRYPPGDVPRLAAAIGEVLGSPATATAMGRAGRELVSRHEIGHTLDAFEAAYRSCWAEEPLPAAG
ncbi:glycosyltransferase [Amycolatopsis sacchari]|uniref:Glycosyltransferase involved in cell wall bisynthesis n=1 Tax=Amycolatopsis sacchari TaxID=115433 RepID=A0A1I3QBH9_9PSEU|nr:glycosyltransferase [Amycolatopsis sacchari]SFJ31248.1 Glycosyltransferase involved in cell wall bisynthesis [Amycolatopsis sacchari]